MKKLFTNDRLLPYLSLVFLFLFFLLVDFFSNKTIQFLFSSFCLLLISSDLLYRVFQQKNQESKTRIYISLSGILSFLLYWLRNYLDFPPRPGVVEQATMLPKVRDLLLVLITISALVFLIGVIVVEISRSSVEAQTKLRTKKLSLLQNFILNLLIVFPIVITINYIAVQRNYNFDLSSKGKYSLSFQSKQLLKEIQQDISITAFYPRNLEASQSEDQSRTYILSVIRPEVEILLAQIKSTNPRINFQFINAEVETDLIGSYRQVANGMLVVRKKRENFTNPNDNPYIEQSVLASSKLDLEDLEKRLVQAILNVTTTQKNIYFTTSNGERFSPIFTSVPTEQITRMIEGLNFMNFYVHPLGYEQQWPQSIPKNADTISVIGPTTAFSEEAKEKILDYITNQKGKMVITVDPLGGETFDWLLNKAGLFYKSDILTQTEGKFGLTRTKSLKKHPISESIPGIGEGLLYPFSGYIDKLSQTTETKFDYEIILESDSDSFDDSNKNGKLDDKELKRIRILGVILKPKKENKESTTIEDSGKVILFSSTAWLTNRFLPKFVDSGNRAGFVNNTYIINSFIWLNQGALMQGIPPKKDEVQPIYLNDSQKTMIWVSTLFLYPLLIVLIGSAYVYIKRKRRISNDSVL